MTRLGRRGGAHRFSAALALITLAGFVFRVVYDVANRHRPVRSDGFRYHYGAILLADGKGFVSPLASAVGVQVPDTGHPPGWTIVLAAATKLGLRTWLEHGLFTSLVGTATIVMVGLAARAFSRRDRVGLIAAALTAFYPFVWLYEREVLSEPLAMLLIATMIWLAYKFLAAPSLDWALALGAVLGVLAMTESELISIAALLVVPIILSRREIDLNRRIGWLASAAAVCLTIMAPWSVYLSTRFDHAIIVTGAVGATMAAGNCPQTYHGPLLGYYSSCSFALPDKSGGDPITRDAQERHYAIDYMRAHESRVPVVMAARIGRTFGFFRPFQQMRLETVRGTAEWVFRIGFFAYWALLPFSVAGAVIARRRGVSIYPLLAFPVVVVLSVLITIGSVRYRAPAEIPLVILAAVALDAALRAWQQRHRESPQPGDSTSFATKTNL